MNIGKNTSFSPKEPPPPGGFSRFQTVTLICLGIALVLLGIDYRASLIMIGCYLALVMIAPFCFRLGLFLPVIYQAVHPGPYVCLTFDDGPDPAITEPLLSLLERYRIKATFFVVGERASRYPELIRRMIRSGHEIGNHSQTHDPVLMLRRYRTLYHEITGCQQALIRYGIVTYAFRPPVGITNPKLPHILNRLNLYCVGFNNRPRDFGNRRIGRLAEKVLTQLRAGNIILLHDRIPDSSFSLVDWLREVEQIIIGIQQQGLTILPLSALIARPVMQIMDQNLPPLTTTESSCGIS